LIIMASKFRKELRKQMITFIVAAFGFVAALVWRDAIMAWLEPIMVGDGAFELTITAIIVTIIAVSVIYMLSRVK
jgi:hypothetical protein